MKQYSFQSGRETCVPVLRRKSVNNLNRACCALRRAVFAIDEANVELDKEGDHVGSEKGREIVGTIEELREWCEQRAAY